MTSVIKAPTRVEMLCTRPVVDKNSDRVGYMIKYYVSGFRVNKGPLCMTKTQWHCMLDVLESADRLASFTSDWAPTIQVKGDKIQLNGTNVSSMLRHQIAKPFADSIRNEIASGALALQVETSDQAQPVLDQPAEDVEIATLSTCKAEDDFFEQVKSIKEDMHRLFKLLAKSNGSALAVEDIAGLQKQIKDDLKAMKTEIEEFANSRQRTHTELRLRTNMHKALATSFADLQQRCNAIKAK